MAVVLALIFGSRHTEAIYQEADPSVHPSVALATDTPSDPVEERESWAGCYDRQSETICSRNRPLMFGIFAMHCGAAGAMGMVSGAMLLWQN